jgi:hypothetical protein
MEKSKKEMSLLTKMYNVISTAAMSFIAIVLLSASVYAADFYISPTGDDNNAGTLEQPFASITMAQSIANAGDTVYILGGTYTDFAIANSDSNYNYVHDITKSGITYKGYSTEDTPIFDFSNVTTEKRVCAFRIAETAKEVTISNIKVTGVKVGEQKQSECFRINGIVEFNQVSCYNNEANGFYFTGAGGGACINCDAYNNIAPTALATENTDGFGAHGSNNVLFKNCRSWNNSDDGFDCISCKGSNIFDNCWAFDMNAGGNGNGFKVGGGTKTGNNVPIHIVSHCLSVNNSGHGFYANHQPGRAAIWTYNTAYNNAHGNYNMLERISPADLTDMAGTREILHYNIAYKGIDIEQANLPAENAVYNSWTKEGAIVDDTDFQSLDASELAKPRKQDGSLPDVTFMHLASDSDLVGLGCFN